MASRDQATFMETLLAFKRALKRKAYESDSDSSIDQATNRGNKLKKRARYVHEGQLAPPTGPSSYKEVVEHGGYRREIIYRNPPLIDEDGYDIESDDDEERIQEAVTAAAESNPYAGIRLESILAPLTAITDLPTHPTLSRPLTSKALTELSSQGCNWMHKENSALWKVKPLLTKLCGDHNWVACDLMVTAADAELFEDDYLARVSSRTTNGSASGDTQRVHTPRLNGDGHSDHPNGQVNGDGEKCAQANGAKEAPLPSPDADISMVDASATEERQTGEAPSKDPKKLNGDKQPAAEQTDEREPAKDEVQAKAKPTEAEETNNNNNHTGNGVDKAEEVETPSKDGPETSDNSVTKDTQAPAQGAAADEAQDAAPPPPPPPPVPAPAAEPAAPTNPAPSELNGSRALSLTPDVFDDQLVHPLFLAPRSARPERDLGLPEQEAEDVRRLLQLWVQKQEEVARGTKKLYEGLLKADRLRATVFKWAKAEAHAGPNRDMSDGEDWYDKEEWGLVDDLKKGHDEEEEDTQQTQKKTRNRR